MAMTVLNNPSAMMTLGQLNKNINKVGKDLKKVSSGMKINGAGDAAAEYSISEKMRVRIRGLDQDVQNVKNGKSLLNIAAGGIDNIVDELRNLKELAINAANDTNTDADRATMQKEFDNRRANIDDIANTTNYNGKLLLRGDYNSPVQGVLMDPLKYNTVWKNVSQPTIPGTFTINVNPVTGATSATIDSDGVYTIPSGFSGTINVNAKNVQLSGTGLTDVNIVGPSGGGANLWLENLDITNST